MALPAWLAVTVQLPVASIVTIAPLVLPVVQTAGVVLAKVMGLPDWPPVPASVKVPAGM